MRSVSRSLRCSTAPASWTRPPYTVFAELLDEDERYLCSIRTMYRILAENNEVRERRDVLCHPTCSAPSLVATAPRQVWSWDITKLLGPVTWTYYHLYVIIDIFSRYVVGWMVADRESSELAKQLIWTSCQREGISPNSLVLHSDRGPAMKSKQVAHLLADLGVTKSHSRPHVSNDNAFSEAQFKTMKYRPEFPQRFDSQLHARAFGQHFFPWYNEEHRHSGLGLMTPKMVHEGQFEQVELRRAQVLEGALKAHPERFVRGKVSVPSVPRRVVLGVDPDVELAPRPLRQPTLEEGLAKRVGEQASPELLEEVVSGGHLKLASGHLPLRH
jgi:putative transposase